MVNCKCYNCKLIIRSSHHYINTLSHHHIITSPHHLITHLFHHILQILHHPFDQPLNRVICPTLRVSGYHNAWWQCSVLCCTDNIISTVITLCKRRFHFIAHTVFIAIPATTRISQIKHILKIHIKIRLSDNAEITVIIMFSINHGYHIAKPDCHAYKRYGLGKTGGNESAAFQNELPPLPYCL